jgi:hypothetical protein
MISFPANTHIWIAAGITDLRRGFNRLSKRSPNLRRGSNFTTSTYSSVAKTKFIFGIR